MNGTLTFGELRYDTTTPASWVLDVEPDTAIDAKRILRQCQQTASGPIRVDATDDAARTLDWLMMRWPLRMSAADRRRLKKAVRDHKAREQRVRDVLSGAATPIDAGTDFLTSPVQLRTYQVTARDLIWNTRRLGLFDELGLGKTYECLAVLADPKFRPALAVTKTHLPWQWLKEARAMYPDLRVHIATKATPYDLRDADGRDPDLIIMSYSKIAGWHHHLAGRVRTVLFDEVQELRRTGTEKYTGAQHLSQKAHCVVGASATPIMNFSGAETFAIMDAIAPDCLGTPIEFARAWCSDATYGLGRHSRITDPDALRSRLERRGLWLRRTREQVGIELPPICHVEQYVPANTDVIRNAENAVAEVARLILSNNASRQERWTAAGQLDWQMRQATGVAKAPFVAAFVELLLASTERIVVYAWHRQVHEILAEALKAHHALLYTGTETPIQKQRAVDAFTSGDCRVLIMSVRSGEGLDGLQDIAHVCVFAELDWSAGIHKQCIGRLGRPGQQESTIAYFAVTDSGSDPIVLDVVNLKAMDADSLVNPSQDAPADAPSVGADRINALARSILDRANDTERKAG